MTLTIFAVSTGQYLSEMPKTRKERNGHSYTLKGTMPITMAQTRLSGLAIWLSVLAIWLSNLQPALVPPPDVISTESESKVKDYLQ